jgi:murein DD-endopeptidase MepM/ murein hydrolase activator NlpD
VVRVSRIFGEQLFPERQLLLKSSGGVHHIALPGWLQAMVLVACIVSVGGIAYLAMGFARLHEVVDQRIDEARSVSSATVLNESASMDSLRAELAQMRRDLATVNQNYADITARYQQSHDRLTSLATENDKLRNDLNTATLRARDLQDARDDAERRAKLAEQAANSKSGNLSQLTKNLDDNRSELRQSEAERTMLQNRVQQLQMELQAANGRAALLPGQAAQGPVPNERQPQIATDPARVQAAPVGSAAAPLESAEPPDIVAPIPERKPDAGPHARAGSSELEKLLVSTGIDIDHMLNGLNSLGATQSGRGGPYIALGSDSAAAFREDELRKLAKILPLAAPLGQYQFESGFGIRIDPINHRTAFHPGLDLAAPYRSAVYSTAPGAVVFTGTRGEYGRMVEIDHGHGIVTRYAHLHRILVARGQRIGAHVEIGELGSTGRSTGPHVHYEVLVDGTPLDPAKFMEVGKNVVQINAK